MNIYYEPKVKPTHEEATTTLEYVTRGLRLSDKSHLLTNRLLIEVFKGNVVYRNKSVLKFCNRCGNYRELEDFVKDVKGFLETKSYCKCCRNDFRRLKENCLVSKVASGSVGLSENFKLKLEEV